jgi:hypothetical protein
MARNLALVVVVFITSGVFVARVQIVFGRLQLQEQRTLVGPESRARRAGAAARETLNQQL